MPNIGQIKIILEHKTNEYIDIICIKVKEKNIALETKNFGLILYCLIKEPDILEDKNNYLSGD